MIVAGSLSNLDGYVEVQLARARARAASRHVRVVGVGRILGLG
jgi:hypothetical protein